MPYRGAQIPNIAPPKHYGADYQRALDRFYVLINKLSVDDLRNLGDLALVHASTYPQTSSEQTAE